MVKSTVEIGRLYSHDILDILHNAKRRSITLWIGTNLADVGIRNVMAHAAILYLVAKYRKSLCQRGGDTCILAQEMQNKAQSCLAPYTR